MSEEGFLKRWSRRKRAVDRAAETARGNKDAPPVAPLAELAAAPSAEATPTQPSPASGKGEQRAGAVRRGHASQPGGEEKPIDPATLPPIESLGSDSDYTVFLRKGVPEALRQAALRKAWMSDAFIREFRSPAIDYGWDFTAPEYSLRATDNVAKLVSDVFAAPANAAAPAKPPATDQQTGERRATVSGPITHREPLAPPRKTVTTQPAKVDSAPSQASPKHVRRKHGGALPS